jgi:hypothetical protein
MAVPFEFPLSGISPTPTPGLSELIFDEAIPPAFKSVRVFRPTRGAFLIAVWAGEREAVQQTLAISSWAPPDRISVVSAEAREVTGSPPSELLFTYDLRLNNLTERRLIICVAGRQPTCSAPITTHRSTADGKVLFQAAVTFPSLGVLEYSEEGAVRRALFVPELWRTR